MELGIATAVILLIDRDRRCFPCRWAQGGSSTAGGQRRACPLNVIQLCQ